MTCLNAFLQKHIWEDPFLKQGLENFKARDVMLEGGQVCFDALLEKRSQFLQMYMFFEKIRPESKVGDLCI